MEENAISLVNSGCCTLCKKWEKYISFVLGWEAITGGQAGIDSKAKVFRRNGSIDIYPPPRMGPQKSLSGGCLIGGIFPFKNDYGQKNSKRRRHQ